MDRRSIAARSKVWPVLVCLCLAGSSCSRNPETADQTAPSAEANSKQAAPEADNANPDWVAEYEEMAAALDLSEQEEKALREAFATRDRVISAWMANNGARLEELEGEMAAAAKNRDLNAVQQSISQAKPLRDELHELIQSHQETILATLSAENREHWAAHGLAERLLELTQPLELTPAQVAQIRDQALSAAQQSADEPNPSAAGYLLLERFVMSQVLNDEQRRAFEAVKQKNPLRSLR